MSRPASGHCDQHGSVRGGTLGGAHAKWAGLWLHSHEKRSRCVVCMPMLAAGSEGGLADMNT
jgi:hypothetical protein